MGYGSSLQRKLFYAAPPLCKNFLSSAYGWAERRRRHGAHYRKHFAAVEASQWWTTERHLPLQLERVKALLEHAEQHSPYYADLFRRLGFDPRRMSGLQDLAALPILTKADFRAHFDRISSRAFGPKDVHRVSTGGSTGTSLTFPETWDCFQREYAFRFHNYHCGGIELGRPWVICAGHPVADPERARPPFWVRDYTNNWLVMSSYHLTERNLPSYVEALERCAPDMIGGYPSSVYMLALANKAGGGRVRPKAVFTSSETLLDFQRAAIEDSFGCKAHTYYGNGERCAFVAECDQGRLHVRMDHSLVEFLDEQGRPAAPETEARMVCTGFGNPATPLIRYEVGDAAVVAANQRCPCGRGGILLRQLTGRVDDYVVTPDGRFVGRLDHLFKDSRHVRMAQIVQRELGRILIRVVRDPGYGAADEAAIRSEARSRLGSLVEVQFDYVSEIPRRSNGKYAFVVSELKTAPTLGRHSVQIPPRD